MTRAPAFRALAARSAAVRFRTAPLVAALSFAVAPAGAQPTPAAPTPGAQLGFQVGADRKLADWGQIVGYFRALAAASPAVRVDTLGPSTQGRPLIFATISTAENIRKIEAIRAAQARLADPRGLSAEEEARLVATQPSVLVIQCNIHSSEIASSQMVMELAYRLATVDTLQRALANEVVILIPSANPDGQDMVVQWYRRQLGTKWEGGPMPWLYHPYIGHDNNRDWYMMTQRETRLITDLLYRRWFPEVFYDVHQQGNEGMRITVPPHVDPIDPNVDALIVRGINHVGAEMSLALEERGKQGVGDGATYDLWWHGGARSTPTRHNAVGVLTEAASVKVATPIFQKPEDLRGHSRGLSRYERRVNFPNPWPGGWWRLRDIVDYELIAAEAVVRMLSQQREEYVRNFVHLGRKQVHLGERGGPFAYVLPAAQRDTFAANKLVEVLRYGGVEVTRAGAAFTAGGQRYEAGSYVVPMAQPYRAHAKDLLERQDYPRIEQYPGGPIERPYDVTGWTLPLQMGVRAVAVDSPFAMPAGAQVPLPREPSRPRPPVRQQRIALYKPWTGSIDEGWTRWLLEQYGYRFTSLTDSAVKRGGLRDQFDVIIVPDMTLREVRSGMSDSLVPPQYAGGLGTSGLAELKRFADAGGTLVLLDRSSELGTSELGVAARLIRVPPRQDDRGEQRADVVGRAADTLRRVQPLYAPGSILRVLVDTGHPVARGLPDTVAVYFTNSVTFDVAPGSGVRVIARYPERGEDILVSGFLQGAEAIAGKAAAVEAPVGRGRVVMFGFRPQYRGQSYGTFPMLFNALSLGGGSARR